jgi:hypothetical protein
MNEILKLLQRVDANLHRDASLASAVEDVTRTHQARFDHALRCRRNSQPSEPFQVSWSEAAQSTDDSLRIAALGDRIRRRASGMEKASATDHGERLAARPSAFQPAWMRSPEVANQPSLPPTFVGGPRELWHHRRI